jgi:heme A synthase
MHQLRGSIWTCVVNNAVSVLLGTWVASNAASLKQPAKNRSAWLCFFEKRGTVTFRFRISASTTIDERLMNSRDRWGSRSGSQAEKLRF